MPGLGYLLRNGKLAPGWERGATQAMSGMGYILRNPEPAVPGRWPGPPPQRTGDGFKPGDGLTDARGRAPSPGADAVCGSWRAAAACAEVVSKDHGWHSHDPDEIERYNETHGTSASSSGDGVPIVEEPWWLWLIYASSWMCPASACASHLIDQEGDSLFVNPCILSRLLGGTCIYEKVVIYQDVLDANAYSLPFWNEIWVDYARISGAYQSYAAGSSGGGDGETACVVAELAGTLLHEIAHTCGATEGYAHLLSHFYRYYFAVRNGYDHADCCAVQMGLPPSWSEFDYSYAYKGPRATDDVRNYVCYASTTRTSSSWTLQCPC